MEIFHLMSKGLSNRDICGLLGISTNTVKIHVAGILRNLGVSNRTEAVFAFKDLLTSSDQATRQRQQMRLVDRLGRPAIAVLPFEDLSDARPGEHLSEGVVDELLVRLSAWRWFPIISFSSSRHFDPAQVDAKSIGEKLGAQYLIHGSLRRAQQHIRVSVHVIDASTSKEVWSRSFDVVDGELFELQDVIARQILTHMAPELVSAEIESTEQNTPIDTSAWHAVCKGLFLMNKYTRDGVAEASIAFREALSVAPDYSLAWHGLVTSLEIELFEQWVTDPAARIGEIKQAAEENFRLNPEDAMALTDMGLVGILMGQAESAQTYLERAVLQNPSAARTLMLLAQVLGMRGSHDEAILYMEELMRIDPHSRASTRYLSVIAACHLGAGRPEMSASLGQQALVRDAKAHGAYMTIIASYVALEQMDKAQEWVSKMAAEAPDFHPAHRLALMKPLTQPDAWARQRDLLARAGLDV